MLSKLIYDNYNIEVKKLELIDRHFGTEIWIAQTDMGKYIVKILPLYMNGVEVEGYITEYLYNNGIHVARLIKTKDNTYHVKTNDLQFHVQEYIEGKTLKINSAPEWFLEKSAITLGKIQNVLKSYGELKTSFNANFFSKSNIDNVKEYYTKELNMVDNNNITLISELEERLKHLDRISSFDIDTTKLTYSNSHGDFHIGQIITYNRDITVIDWTSASRLPVCLDLMMSYTMADPKCAHGKIDSDRLKKYMHYYLKHFNLNDYDIQKMPYVFYYQQIMCHYNPPYINVADSYKPICRLINYFTNSLYENVEIISNELHR